MILIIGCVCAYLLASVNPAIILSKLIHKQDIREFGSGNPGFTNYKRVFGGIDAWLVFALDLLKAIVPILVFSLIVAKGDANYEYTRAFSAQLIGLCAMVGHSYPIWYKFKGGKAFTTSMATIYIVDWKVALIATAIFLTLLLTVKYMSLSSMTFEVACTTLLFVFEGWKIALISLAATLLIIWRHKSNIARLVKG